MYTLIKFKDYATIEQCLVICIFQVERLVVRLTL